MLCEKCRKLEMAISVLNNPNVNLLMALAAAVEKPPANGTFECVAHEIIDTLQ